MDYRCYSSYFKPIQKMKKQFHTPEHLQLLGIEVCKDCGHTKSVENSICYNCGFESDDLDLHEKMLNEKFINSDGTTKYHIVKQKKTVITSEQAKYHIMKNGFSLCGLNLITTVKYEVVKGLDIRSKFLIDSDNCCKTCFKNLNK